MRGGEGGVFPRVRPERGLGSRVRSALLKPAFAAALLAALAACAGVKPPATTVSVAIDPAAALAAVNGFRAANGAPALKLDRRLMAAAAAQSAAMAGRGRMDHAVAGPLSRRAQAAGYEWSTVAENIAEGYASFDAAMAGWIASPHHRANLLNPGVTEIGFAAAHDLAGGRRYWTEVFGAPK